jgi:hypothetical protein
VPTAERRRLLLGADRDELEVGLGENAAVDQHLLADLQADRAKHPDQAGVALAVAHQRGRGERETVVRLAQRLADLEVAVAAGLVRFLGDHELDGIEEVLRFELAPLVTSSVRPGCRSHASSGSLELAMRSASV